MGRNYKQTNEPTNKHTNEQMEKRKLYTPRHKCRGGININIFLSNDHIWNYWNLNSPISQTQLDSVFKFSGYSRLINCCKVIKDWKLKSQRFQNCVFRAGQMGLGNEFEGSHQRLFNWLIPAREHTDSKLKYKQKSYSGLMYEQSTLSMLH